jgi:CRP-like cAMP-binding protein
MGHMQQTIAVRTGQVLIEQGQQGSGFYILQQGTLEVIKDEIILAVLMYPGTIFGEMGDILGRPRSCTVRAKSDCVVEYYQFATLDDMVTTNPEIAVKMLKTLASRLDRTTQKLIDTARENPLWSTK